MAGNRKSLATELTSILNGALAGYERSKESDRVAQARSGATTIQTKSFANEGIKKQAHADIFAARDKALSAIDRETERVMGDLSKAPSTEAANYIAAIAQRDDLSADEVSAALGRYTDHASQKAIRSAAARSGLRCGSKTLEESYIDDLRTLRKDVIDTYTPATFEDGTKGYFGLTAAQYENFGKGEGLDGFSILETVSRSSRA